MFWSQFKLLGEMLSHKVWNIFGFEFIALSKRLFLVIVDKFQQLLGFRYSVATISAN